jgi:hypothetical protein
LFGLPLPKKLHAVTFGVRGAALAAIIAVRNSLRQRGLGRCQTDQGVPLWPEVGGE